SRGKLYRTQLVRTGAGYVSRNHLLASLDMLCCDACVSPRGELVVSVHSGGPDWGSGPSGKGKLYKINHARPEPPQPSLVWPQSASELCIAFDRPLELDQVRDLASRVSIDVGPFVAAGDRFESLAPGYQAVQDQFPAARFDLPVLAAALTPDHRQLILSTK